MTFLLDTSALLAHFRGEPGAIRVQELFENSENSFLIASISITEFSRRMFELGAAEKDITEALEAYVRLLSDVVAVDRVIARSAFILGRQSRARLPLADALIAACAQSRGAILVHRDPHFEALPSDHLAMEVLA